MLPSHRSELRGRLLGEPSGHLLHQPPSRLLHRLPQFLTSSHLRVCLHVTTWPRKNVSSLRAGFHLNHPWPVALCVGRCLLILAAQDSDLQVPRAMTSPVGREEQATFKGWWQTYHRCACRGGQACWDRAHLACGGAGPGPRRTGTQRLTKHGVWGVVARGLSALPR